MSRLTSSSLLLVALFSFSSPALLFTLQFFSSSYAAADDSLPVAVAELGTGMFYHAKVHLGALKSGSQEKIEFKLENGTKDVFHVPSIKTNCNCANISFSAKELKPGESAVVSAIISTSSRSDSVRKALSIALHSDGKDFPVLISCSYDLAGLLSFKEHSFVGSFNTNLKREPNPFRIPVLITPPIELKSIRFRGTNAFEDGKYKLEADEDALYLLCKLPREAIGEHGAAGSIVLTDEISGAVAELPCVISSVGDFKFVPSILSLSWNKELLCYEGNALFKYEGDKLQRNSVLKAELTGITGVAVEVKPVGNKDNLFRIAVTVKPPQYEPFHEQDVPEFATWQFVLGDKRYRFKSKVSFFPVTGSEEVSK